MLIICISVVINVIIIISVFLFQCFDAFEQVTGMASVESTKTNCV